ncbi:hypothetical protein ACFP9V_14080 [Deinococcus radiopugnans]|uniref:Uncharacterized protein n=1 Tax=Deinococcus radiopugnans ATCC 19172 TaxID=585398 RepID=A0A5C4YAR6_9DEIO|nr:hypothetical protein [Deinococcus radiopugnans]MBB6016203.1 hypothetical protein [Deinococcus radiopugnans ATCC 19172]TNM72222.1 hypothetical protein FHR04_05190 [Deinococcus radiopugnans ATCC 19172]
MTRRRPTLNTLIRVTKALREPEARPGESGGFRETARRAAQSALNDPRVQSAAGLVRDRAEAVRIRVGDTADRNLERLIGEARARRGEATPDEVAAVLETRRRERDARIRRALARQELLNRAETPEQRQILTLVAGVTAWAGGSPEAGPLRYTALLDRLAPGGSAEAEMAVHRALWTLAERRVLAVSPHGVVTAVQLLEQGRAALPETD